MWTKHMPKTTHRLTAVAVQNATKPGLHADGAGLYLKVDPGGSKSWVFRFTRDHKTRYFGLGSSRVVSLANARGLAAKARQDLELDKDPIETRKQLEAEERLADARSMKFKECAEALINSQEAGWKNTKHRQQWRNTLKAYVYPKLGHLPVSRITTDLVLEVLQPIWTTKPETASRIRGRIETVLDAAKARGGREGDNPARWRGHLANLLPRTSKVARVEHHAAMPFRDLPAFLEELRQHEGVGPRALEFVILTAARTTEGLGARWVEIDFHQKQWTVPRERMKGGKEHRVPLSARAIAILKELEALKQNEFVFPGMKPGRPLSNMALLMLLRRMKRDDITVHGFRSTFRDWAAETTSFPNFVVEMALAHSIEGKVEAAYRRGDLFEKRRRLMNDWAKYLDFRLTSIMIRGAYEVRA
jgi:integrase